MTRQESVLLRLVPSKGAASSALTPPCPTYEYALPMYGWQYNTWCVERSGETMGLDPTAGYRALSVLDSTRFGGFGASSWGPAWSGRTGCLSDSPAGSDYHEWLAAAALEYQNAGQWSTTQSGLRRLVQY